MRQAAVVPFLKEKFAAASYYSLKFVSVPLSLFMQSTVWERLSFEDRRWTRWVQLTGSYSDPITSAFAVLLSPFTWLFCFHQFRDLATIHSNTIVHDLFRTQAKSQVFHVV